MQGGHPQQPHEQSGLYPPQQQGYPLQHGYPPQGYGHYPQHGAPRGKGKLIAIILVALALAGGGIAVAVVMSNKGSDGGGGGGLDNPEALAKTYVEALAAGDGDKLVSLMPTIDTMIEYSECPADKLEENKKTYAESQSKSRAGAASFKGHGLVYDSLEPEGEKKEFKAGESMGDCKAKKPFAVASYMVVIKFDAADKSKSTFKAGITALVFDGKHYLGPGPVELPPELAAALDGPPSTPDTPPSTAPSAEVTAARADLDLLRAEACACPDRACADQVLTKRKAFAEKYALVAGVMDDPTIQSVGNELMTCISAKMAGSTPPSTEPPVPGKGLPECEAYAVAAERFIKCNKVPKQSRDAVQTAVDTMRKNWGDPATMSEDMKRSAAETCVTLEKSMKDAAVAIGCK